GGEAPWLRLRSERLRATPRYRRSRAPARMAVAAGPLDWHRSAATVGVSIREESQTLMLPEWARGLTAHGMPRHIITAPTRMEAQSKRPGPGGVRARKGFAGAGKRSSSRRGRNERTIARQVRIKL